MKEVEVEVTEKHRLTVLVNDLSEVEEKAAAEAWQLDPDERTVVTLSIREVEE